MNGPLVGPEPEVVDRLVPVLQALSRTVRADGALYHGLVRAGQGGVLRVVDGYATQPWLVPLPDGTPYEVCGIDVASAPSFDAFERVGDDHLEALTRLWGGVPAASALATHVRDGDRHLGCVVLVRRDAAFDELDVARANRLYADLLASLLGVPERHRGAQGHVLVDARGGLVLSSEALALPPGVLRTIASHAPGNGSLDGSTGVLAGGTFATLERLDGPDGPVLLASCVPARPLQVDRLMLLTSLKRRVARDAAQGLTVRDIAQALDRGEETIRTHLKRVYDVLGVGSRVELAEACRDLWR